MLSHDIVSKAGLELSKQDFRHLFTRRNTLKSVRVLRAGELVCA